MLHKSLTASVNRLTGAFGPNPDIHLSFSGCGFLGIYHVGVAAAFHEYAKHVCSGKIAGASAGSLAACGLICEIPFGECTTAVLRIAVQARKRALGPFHPGFDINQVLRDILERILPPDAHVKCSGRLHISVTRVSDGANVMISTFDSREELITALMCSCFIPFYSGLAPPKVKGVAYMDGGFSCNLPVLDENTITVSPLSGENDICPSDDNFNLLMVNLSNTSIALNAGNLYRIARILFPPHPEILSRMCQQGFDDALKFLQRHNLISCTRCLAIESCFDMSPKEEEQTNPRVRRRRHAYDGCPDCLAHKQQALLGSLPETVVRAIQDESDKLNKGIVNWLFRHRPIKLLSFLTLPYVLPIDVTIVAICKLWQLMPHIQQELQYSLSNFIRLVKNLTLPWETKSPPQNAKFSCQVALTEFNYNLESSNTINRRSTSFRRSRHFHARSQSLDNLAVGQPSTSTDGTSSLPRAQRRSYAGLVPKPSDESAQRVISKMNFGFTLSLSQPALATRKTSVMEALRSLGEEDPPVDAIEMAKGAIDWERECLREDPTGNGSEGPELERMLDATRNQEALMSFYYMDENNHVQVTEIFNVPEDNSPPVTQTPPAPRRRKQSMLLSHP